MRAVQMLQRLLYLLLAGNTVWYLSTAPWTKGLDSLAWFVLLMLFALETSYARRLEKRFVRGLLQLLRLFAAAAIALSAYGYAQQSAWLDVINVALWMLVVVLLECELRFPLQVAQQRRLFTGTALLLYAAIATLIPLWALRGEWLDACDAALWLAAFALIEMEMLKPAR